MGWLRFDDKAIDHPKFLALSDGAFRLWVEGGAYCNRHLTDGRISALALRGFRYVTKPRIHELVSVGLWDRRGDDFQMHDYQDWNDTRETVKAKQDAAKERTRKWRNASRDASRPMSQHAHAPSGVVSTEGSSSSEGVQGEDRRAEPDRRVALRRSQDFGRIFLHRWQQESLISTLGDHSEDFGLDTFIDDLQQELAGKALPPDVWKFVQARLHAEIRRRGLAVAEAPADGPTNKRIAGLVAGGEAFLKRAADARERKR